MMNEWGTDEYLEWCENGEKEDDILKVNELYLENMSDDCDGLLKFKNLKMLRCYDCDNEKLLINICSLENLDHLALINSIPTTLPAQLKNLKKLTSIYVSKNNLKVFPIVITELKSLKELTCINNDFETLPPEIGNLTNLYELHCNENNLKYLPAEIEKLISLDVLDCSKNSFNFLPPEIGRLYSLIELNISGCEKLKQLPTEFENLVNLKTFYCSETNILDFPDGIENFDKLKIWDMSNSNCDVPMPLIALLNKHILNANLIWNDTTRILTIK